MRAVRENRDYGSAVGVRHKRLMKMRIGSLLLQNKKKETDGRFLCLME